MKRIFLCLILVVVMLGTLACKDIDPNAATNQEAINSGESASEEENPFKRDFRVQFEFKSRYSPETKESYVVAGEHARIPIGYSVIISVPEDVEKTYKVVITSKQGADRLEGTYQTSPETWKNEYNEHTIMVDDLRHVVKTYAEALESNCQVFDMTDGEKLVYEGAATVMALEARALELINLEIKETTISAEVTHYDDMRYEWLMDSSGALQLAPQTGDKGWSSEGFIKDEETRIAVTIYDELGRFNNFLYIYPKN